MSQVETAIETQPAVEAGLRSINTIIADLSKPIHPARLKTRKQGGKDLPYIPWHQAVKYLDRYAAGWSSEVRSVAGGAWSRYASASCVWKASYPTNEATGQEEEDCGSYGDPSSNAESMALRRAAAKFGLGLYLYNR